MRVRNAESPQLLPKSFNPKSPALSMREHYPTPEWCAGCGLTSRCDSRLWWSWRRDRNAHAQKGDFKGTVVAYNRWIPLASLSVPIKPFRLSTHVVLWAGPTRGLHTGNVSPTLIDITLVRCVLQWYPAADTHFSPVFSDTWVTSFAAQFAYLMVSVMMQQQFVYYTLV
jgi:hypothetical protein